MNRFELHMDKSGLDENRQPVFFIVKEMFKTVETFHHSFWWGGNKCSIARSVAANPILRATKFTWCFVRSALAAQKDRVNLSNQAQRKWKASINATETMLHRGHIVGNLFNIVDGHARLCFVFKEK